jgi:D-alanyl-D-alanine dipeptidase
MNQNQLIITENNYLLYETELLKLYPVFSEAFYPRKTEHERKKTLQNYLAHKDSMVIVQLENDKPVGFCIGYSAHCEGLTEDADRQIWNLLRKRVNLNDYYYLSEVGILPSYRKRGVASKLLEHLIFSKTDYYEHFLVKIHNQDEMGIKLFCDKFSFQPLDRVLQMQDYSFFTLSKTVQKVTYMNLLSSAVVECSEKIVPADYYDGEIVLQNPKIGLTNPNYNDNAKPCQVRDEVAIKLGRINSQLMSYNSRFRLNVLAGLRSMKAQEAEFKAQRQKITQLKLSFDSLYDFIEHIHRMIAVPTVSSHPTGGSVDVTIYDKEQEWTLDMGASIYDLTSKSDWKAKGLTLEQKKNRQMLYDVMTSEGFAPVWSKWWHFSYGDRYWAVYYNKAHAIYDVYG